jgi:hypothetical protein
MDQSVSGWAGNDGADLTSALDETFVGFAGGLADHLFIAPAIRVKGMEPVSANRYRVGTIPGRRPMFVWAALDGGRAAPRKVVEYEIAIAEGKREPQSFRTHEMRFVPDNLLRPVRRIGGRFGPTI